MLSKKRSCAWIRENKEFLLIQSEHFRKLCNRFFRRTPMPGLQVTDEGHRHPYASCEFLLRQVQETPAVTKELTELVRSRPYRGVLSFTPGCHCRTILSAS